MILRRCDRYLLRQMVGPFFLALAGLALFILLNLILRLSDLMVDRGIGIVQMLRLLILWMPELVAWAIPMAALFAVFLGLGRMEHDREIMAFESIGVSLRRILRPLLLASVALSLVTFAVYNWAMPASKQAAEETYRQILFTQSLPRISANTFFTGNSDQYFYVRQYDADDGSVRDVMIYDVSGRLFPQAQSRITLLTAASGMWIDENWELSSGHVYGFDDEGRLTYSGTFENLTLPVGQTVNQIWSQSKSPSEMGIGELLDRIARARASGLPTNESVVELHQRFALPLSAILFVLVGGTISLMFGSKNRSTGIIIGLLIIGLYQGTYFWMQALGRRGAMQPVLAAWIPNLLFGIIGGLLLARVDRLASRDMWNRLRSRLPFLTTLLLVCVVGWSAHTQTVPLHMECQDLSISTDRTEVTAEGSVYAELEGAQLRADTLHLQKESDEQWHLEATGHVTLDFADFDLAGDRVAAEVAISETGAQALSLESSGFQGQSDFENSSGEKHTLYFQGETGRIAFDDDGDVVSIEVRRGEVTTCDCCGLPFRSQPYTIRANRLVVYPSKLIVAFGLTGRLGGFSVLWLPVYVQPLEETLESPLFPAIGRSALRGWFLKWSVPFYVSESLYGSVLFDYFSRYNELGGGLILRYATDRQHGDVNLYAFPAVVGDSEYRVSVNHTITLSDMWDGSATVDYSLKGDSTSLSFSAHVDGDLGAWHLSSSAVRSWSEDKNVVTQRLPDVDVSRDAVTVGTLSIEPSFRAGWIREWTDGNLTSQAERWQVSLDGSVEPFHALGADIAPSFAFAATLYAAEQDRRRTALTVSLPAETDRMSLSYDGTFVSGGSPFDFDQIEARSHIGWSLRSPGSVTVRVDGGVDLAAATIDPILIDLEWGADLEWHSTLTYDVSAAALQEVDLDVNWATDAYSLSASLPYDALEDDLGPLSFAFTAQSEPSELTLSGTLDISGLATLKGALTVEAESGWGATVQASYDSGRPNVLSDTRYGIFRDIGDCLRVGLERQAGEIWVYGSILAFPEAVLRYAPEAASLQFGD